MPPIQTIAIAIALVCFAVSAYLHADLPGKLTCIGLLFLAVAVVI